jgi:hypothetical protein
MSVTQEDAVVVQQVPKRPNPWKRLLALLATPKSANMVAWITSVSFHALLFVTAIIVLPPIVRGLRQTSQEQVVIPDTTLANDDQIGGVPNPGLGKDPTRDASQDTDPNANDSHAWAAHRSDDLAKALSGSAVASGDTLAQTDQKQKGSGGDNAMFSLFNGGGGPTANFGPRGGGQGLGPKSKIFGHGSNVRSIVYVCDASGSMVGQGDDALKTELKRDIANLSPIQQFNIIIFHETKDGKGYDSLPGNKMYMGTPSNKAMAFDFVDNLPFNAANNPIPALEEAFREQPQLVFLLSHGDFNNRYNTTNNKEVAKKIDDLNAEKRVHVNTILLLGEKRNETERKDLEAIMKKLAEQNGGVYKKFYSDDL